MTGQVAIVTGAGRGIGRGIAEALATAGVRVVIADVEASRAKESAAALREAGLEALEMTVDVAQRPSVEAMVNGTLQQWGRIDILVNDAGVNDNTPALELTDETWQWVLSVNLTGTMLCSQTVGRHMVERGYGRIVNIASSASFFGAPNCTAYAATKAGILGLTRVMAVEWGSYGITVNAVCPGNIDTEMLRNAFARRSVVQGVTPEEVVKRIESKTPARRLGTPSDVAAMVHFLASPAAAYVTGQAIMVCGGRTTELS
jgi:NAD(P)-dependent dehydrogenase (short-subunit alcohol dehydrogenase family)